jgi:eukaryotic-like serine/threonine-protein kinase
MSYQKPEPTEEDADLGHTGARFDTPLINGRLGAIVSEARVQSLVGATLRDTYRIVEVLEQGGMGTVYRGEHLRLRRPVAIKVLAQHLSDDPAALHRFRSEAEIISQLHHPHVVHILDFDTTDYGDPYIVMELLSGETLSRRLNREHIMAIRDIAQIVLQTAGGLLVAHAAGIVHRDLKPDNVFLLDMQDSSMFVKLLDFGISKRTAASARVTGEFEVLGTPDYMAPEQIMNTAHADHRADQWSLAAITYEMLAGRIPFCAENIAGTLAKVMNDDPLPITELAAGVPPAMSDVVNRGLAKLPANRFATIMEYAEAFARSAGIAPAPGMTTWVEEKTQVIQKSQTPTLGGMSPIADESRTLTPTSSNVPQQQSDSRDSEGRLPVPTVPRSKSIPPPAPPSKSTPPLGSRPVSSPPLRSRPAPTPPLGSHPVSSPTLASRSPSTPPVGLRSPSTPPVGSRSPSTPPVGSHIRSTSPTSVGAANFRLRRSDPPPNFSLKDAPSESLRSPRAPAYGSLLTDEGSSRNALNYARTEPAPPSDDSQLQRVTATQASATKRTPDSMPANDGAMLKLRATLDEIRQAVTFGEEQRALAKARLAVQMAQAQRQREAKELLSGASELLRPILLRSLGGSHRRVSLVRSDSRGVPSMSPEHVFLLSRVDGTTTIEELLDVSPLSTAETLGILLDFRDQGYLGID